MACTMHAGHCAYLASGVGVHQSQKHNRDAEEREQPPLHLQDVDVDRQKGREILPK